MSLLDVLKIVIPSLNAIVSVILFILMSRMNKEKANIERITALEKKVSDAAGITAERLTRLEVRIEQTPTHTDLAEIHEKINESSDCLSRLEGEFTGAKHTLNLIHEFLMRGK